MPSSPVAFAARIGDCRRERKTRRCRGSAACLHLSMGPIASTANRRGGPRMRRGSAVASMSLVLALVLPVAARADAVADFYRDRQVALLIGYAPGGAYDSFARAVARHLGKHIPGNPAIVPRNMPGAGSLLVLNYIANSAPKDGTELAAIGREL